MSFRDLDEFFDSSLRLPVRGKTYVIPSPDAKTGLWCQRIIALASKAKDGDLTDDDADSLKLDDDEERDLFQRLLGEAFEEMVADGLPWEHVKHCGMTALMWAAGNSEQAEAYWNAGGDPKARPQDRKKSAKSGRQGSRNGSSSPAAKAKATPGAESSSTGP